MTDAPLHTPGDVVRAVARRAPRALVMPGLLVVAMLVVADAHGPLVAFTLGELALLASVASAFRQPPHGAREGRAAMVHLPVPHRLFVVDAAAQTALVVGVHVSIGVIAWAVGAHRLATIVAVAAPLAAAFCASRATMWRPHHVARPILPLQWAVVAVLASATSLLGAARVSPPLLATACVVLVAALGTWGLRSAWDEAGA